MGGHSARHSADETFEDDQDAGKLRLWLSDALTSLNDREQFIVRERKLREKPRTLESLGQEMGLSKAVSYTHLTLPTTPYV